MICSNIKLTSPEESIEESAGSGFSKFSSGIPMGSVELRTEIVTASRMSATSPEDLAGPLRGRQVLDRAPSGKAGIERNKICVINAVKHFNIHARKIRRPRQAHRDRSCLQGTGDGHPTYLLRIPDEQDKARASAL